MNSREIIKFGMFNCNEWIPEWRMNEFVFKGVAYLFSKFDFALNFAIWFVHLGSTVTLFLQ